MPNRFLAAFSSFAVIGLIAACSSKEEPRTDAAATEPDASADAGPSAKEGCEKVAAARCDRFERCSPHMLRATYGNIDDCTAREKLACDKYAQPGVLITGNDLIACAGEVAQISCDDFLRGTIPASCTQPGTLERYAPCGADDQCKSGACGTHGKTCGTCTLVARAGDDCKELNCATGAACLSGTCVKLGKAGASCDSARLPCLTGLACSRGKCVEPVRNEEAECDPDSSQCDTTAGLYCDREVKQCRPVTLAEADEACGFLNRIYVTCAAGALCSGGHCTPPAKDGESCASDTQCRAPSRCISGKCAVIGAAACE